MKSLLLAPLALVLACSSAASVASTSESEIEEATFGACPPGYQSECALLDMPLDHAQAGGETIKVHIARHRASTPSARQVWLLAGGPGQAGDIWNATVTALAQRMPDTDIYVLDHRGTGHSHRLTCTQQDVPTSAGGYYLPPSDVPACLDELKANGDYARLRYFTSRQAAADLAQAIRATRAPAQKVYVWGGSYGTHLAHRFLQIEPNLADGIVFDGYLTPGTFGFIDYDKGAEESGELFARGCANDAICAAHMGPDPLAKMRTILDGLRTKPCHGIDADAARTRVTALLDTWGGRGLIMPLLHRLERCSSDDATAIDKLATTMGWTPSTAPTAPPVYSASGIVQYNIALSELWSPTGKTATKTDLVAAADEQAFLSGESYAGDVVDLRTLWPLPADDWSKLPMPVTNSRTSLLFLSSGLDIHTPPSQAAAVDSLYPKATRIALAGGAHTPSEQSPLKSNPARQCGDVIVESFVTTGTADASCATNDLLPVWYSAPTSAWANVFWGTTDDWGDGAPAAGSSAPAAPVAMKSSSAKMPRSATSP
jgi:pimeloyl-ACP methyl ester carboxylesterase